MEVDSMIMKLKNDFDYKDGDDIDYNKFLKVNVVLEHQLTDQKLKSAFHLFDLDGDGTITMQEIQYLLGGH